MQEKPEQETLTNTRELFGLREDETLAEAIARQPGSQRLRGELIA